MKVPGAIELLLRQRNRVTARQDVHPLGIDDVRSAELAAHELEAGPSSAIGLDVAPEVIPHFGGLDVEQLGESGLDLQGALGLDHASIGPHEPDTTCPLSVAVERGDIVLYLESEGIGVLLSPDLARTIAAELEAAATDVLLARSRT